MTTAAAVGYADLMRDVRHLAARAADDLADWLAYLELEGKADRTLYSYMREVALLLREYPDLQLGEFTAREINNVLAQKPERSRYITRSIFNGFFQWAADSDVYDEGGVEHPRIPRNPLLRGVPSMRQPKRRPKDIFSEEEIALLEGLPMPDGPLWTILFFSGLRRGEARRLRREHIDLERERLTVLQGKGNKDRIVPIGWSQNGVKVVLKAVADLDLTEGLQRGDHLWYTRPGAGKHRARRAPIADTTFERWYRNGIDAAGVRYLNPHQTRHTFGHRTREWGVDIELRKIAMGHESIETTDHYYGRLTVEDLAARIAEIEV